MSVLPDPLAGLAPVWAAPMAGGVTTTEFVVAAARAGHVAQLAGGYRTADGLAADIRAVRDAGVDAFGVNLFAPGAGRVDPTAYAAYRDELASDAAAVGADLPAGPIEDDDGWTAKTDLLAADPVPVVSFTFALPTPALVERLRRAGTWVAQTVTTAAEARAASSLGVDGLIVQGFGAGGHSGGFDAERRPADRHLADLVAEIAASVPQPMIAAGGIGDRSAVQQAMDAGAAAVSVGTALLRTDEAGTVAAHRAALERADVETVLTRAFTGRWARALENGFVRRHPDAPPGYPALHHLTRPIRAAGDPERLHLWAGVEYRRASPGPVADRLAELMP